jgi:methyl-accepting chemotaxis protein
MSRRLLADVSFGGQVDSAAATSFAIHHMQRVCGGVTALIPSILIVSIVLVVATWNTAGWALTLLGCVFAVATMAAMIPVSKRLEQLLAEDPDHAGPVLARLAHHFTANAVFSGMAWSITIAGVLISNVRHLSDLGITIGIAATAIGSLNYLSMPRINLVWLLSMTAGLSLAITATGYIVDPYFYPLSVCFAIIVWRSTMVICRHFAGYIRQSQELVDVREREFAAEQRKAQERAEQDLAAQAMLAQQREHHTEERRRAMADLAEAFDRSVMHTIDSLSTALNQLGICASALHDIGEETGDSAAQVTARAANVGMSVQNVAGAAAQLNQSAQSITKRVEDQHLAATAARSSSLEGSEAVGALAQQAAKVSEIATLIEEIASQTNLLALNATIEAARAGEAGRGFAVVAHEVKQLSGQTRGAINSVGQTVNGIRTRMNFAEITIDSIAGQIDLVSEGAAHIARVISEQSEATRGINSHAQQVASDARSMQDTARAVSHNAQRVKSMSDDMREVTAQLEDQASVLRSASAAFLAELRAA